MTTATTTGTSYRTPAKQEILRSGVMRYASVACTGKVPGQAASGGVHFIDLTAGDAQAEEESPPEPLWGNTNKGIWKQTSPGILISAASIVAKHDRPATVDLYERNRQTYATLVSNLVEAGLMHESESAGMTLLRTRRGVTVRAFHGSGADADVSSIRPGDVAFVNNDPNLIVDWAMRPGFLRELQQRTKPFTTQSTLGCNVRGIKRMDRPTREGWYGHIQAVVDSLMPHHDLLLAAIERDAAQWAYMLTVPAVWLERTDREVRRAFARLGRNMRTCWLRRDGVDATNEQLDILFLTNAELKAAGR